MLDDPYWVNSEGEILYPQDIDDIYLMNIINYMEKYAEYFLQQEIEFYNYIAKSEIWRPTGDIAVEHFDGFGIYLHSVDPLEWVKETETYKVMENEMKARGLCFSQKRVGLI